MTKRSLLLALALVVGMILFVTQPGFAKEIAEIQRAIQSKGVDWVAGETSMTQLPPAERMKRVGLLLPRVTGKEKLLSPRVTALPPYLDWRDNGGVFVTPVRNQGSCGSCWAFATTAALESLTLIVNHTPGVNLDLAEQVLLSCSGAGNCETGGSIDLASSYIASTGLPLESCDPYLAVNGNCANACANWQASAYKITSWSWVATTSPTVEGIKNALFTKGPLVTTMAVYDDFYAYVSGIYRYTTGNLAGNHAVLVVGYDDIGQYFIVKNSWGQSWGESGYFKIAYSEMSTVANFGDYTIAYTGSVPACSSFVTQVLGSEGGTVKVGVSVPSGCSWTAASNSSWITIASGSSGTGDGSVILSVSANAAPSARSGSVTVAGQLYPITQEGQPCGATLSPATQSFTATGGSGVVNVTVASGCSWTAVSNDLWVTITSGSSGSGNGAVYYTVSQNTGSTARTATLTIAGQTHTVSQAGLSCSYSISPTSDYFGYSAGSGSVSVTAQSGCSWTAVSNESWISITSGYTGSGNGTVTYSVGTATADRTGTMTIAGNTFTVTQEGPICGYSISPTSQSFGAAGGTGSVSVATSIVGVTKKGSNKAMATGCTWTAASNASWIVVTNEDLVRTDNGTVTYTVAQNTSTSSRSGTMTIAGKTFTVNQSEASCSYSISPTSGAFTSSGGTGSVSVTATTGCSWTASSNATWITITAGASGSGNGTVSFSVGSNGSTSSRTGTMTIAGNTYTVTQQGVPCTYSISPTSQSFGSTGGTGSVSVTATSGCSWTAVSNDSWITVTSGASGSGSGTVGYSVASNTGTSTRTGTVTIAGNTFTLTQGGSGGVPDIAINPTSLNFGNVSRYNPVTKPLTVSNTGTGPLIINSVSFEGPQASSWRQTNNCTTLAPGSSCTINVTLAPQIVNVSVNSYLVIASNDPDENPLKPIMYGKGVNW